MILFSNQSASSTSFSAIILLSMAGLFIIGALGPSSLSAEAFSMQNRRSCSRQRCKLKATRRNAILCNGTNKINDNTQHNIDIAKVWCNSLEEKIPWHASSRRYLSEGLPSLDKEANDCHSTTSTP